MSTPPSNDLIDVNALPEQSPDAERLGIARSFVAARRAARPLVEFPGTLPPDLATGYAIQDTAVGLWRDRIAGWKVGLVAPAEQRVLSATRLAGPIFQANVFRSKGSGSVILAAIPGGFAAIEIELVVKALADAPPTQIQWSLEQAAAYVGEWRLGVEFAASPLATINDLGATAVVSDFGNNTSLVLGPQIDSRLVMNPASLMFETTIEGQSVGVASAAVLPGGPLEAVRFLLGHLAERGRPLLEGQWISTGAITGVHRIFPGQRGCVEMIGHGRLEVQVEAAVAENAGP